MHHLSVNSSYFYTLIHIRVQTKETGTLNGTHSSDLSERKWCHCSLFEHLLVKGDKKNKGITGYFQVPFALSLKSVCSDNQHQSKSLWQYMIHPLVAHSTSMALIALSARTWAHTSLYTCTCADTLMCIWMVHTCVPSHTQLASSDK